MFFCSKQICNPQNLLFYLRKCFKYPSGRHKKHKRDIKGPCYYHLIPSLSRGTNTVYYQRSKCKQSNSESKTQRKTEYTEQTHSANCRFEPTSETEKQMENSRNGWGKRSEESPFCTTSACRIPSSSEKDRSYQEEVF